MNQQPSLIGFTDPIRQSQAVFSQVMNAMALPGTLHHVGLGLAPPAPLLPAAAALVLALCDFESSLWIDETMQASSEVREYLAFNTGAPLAANAKTAAFALISDGAALPSLSEFSEGTLEFPDRSTTLIVQCGAIEAGTGWVCRGPGIEDEIVFSAGPLPDAFLKERIALRAFFPLGIDVIFTSGSSLTALPRSTHLSR